MATDRKQSTPPALNKLQLAEKISRCQPELSLQDVKISMDSILDCISSALSQGEDVEIRGFGSIALRRRPPRNGRNPKSNEKIWISEKFVPHFKPSAKLRKRVDNGVDRD